MLNKRILFLTGTRADFGKLKSLIEKVENSDQFESHIFVTGMHMLTKYGMTAREVEKSGFQSIYKYINQNENDGMDTILSKTIAGLSDYVHELNPDMIVIHGDRVEALAGAIVGALNNILVAHVEGGEVSGTIDELIRHSVSKLSHIHFVCNQSAKNRLLQLGELESSIFVIGSPDLDVMTSKDLPSIDYVKDYYDINFDTYSVFMYHPVTTEFESLHTKIEAVVSALIESGDNYVVIFPNNDHGTEIILNEFKRFEGNDRFLIFPSIRFENFLTLIKYSEYMIGNSSAGVREAPFYGLPSIDIGSRQANRATASSIINVPEDKEQIISRIEKSKEIEHEATQEFGEGNSCELFYEKLRDKELWNIPKQKRFVDIV